MHRWLPLILLLPVALLGACGSGDAQPGGGGSGATGGHANPNGSCSTGALTKDLPADLGPMTVVGTGTPDSGTVDDAGTAVGTNTKSITITNSTIQGVP